LGSDEAWRTLLQCFRTKLFLATSDEFTARTAAELCGRADLCSAIKPCGSFELTSRSTRLQAILVMKAPENWLRDYAVPVTDPMTLRDRREIAAIGNHRSETRVRTSAIVVRYPFSKNLSQVSFDPRNDPVEALAPNRANHPFAERVRLRRARTGVLRIVRPIAAIVRSTSSE